MSISEIKSSKKVATKEEAVTFLADLLNKYVSPTFGIMDDEGYKKNPHYVDEYVEDHKEYMGEDEYSEEDMPEYIQECRETLVNWEEAKTLATEISQQWGLHLDIEFFETVMAKMRGNGAGMWNSSSIGC